MLYGKPKALYGHGNIIHLNKKEMEAVVTDINSFRPYRLIIFMILPPWYVQEIKNYYVKPNGTAWA